MTELSPRVARALQVAIQTLSVPDCSYERIATGGTGVVFRGRTSDGRDIAVKIPRYGAEPSVRDRIVENGLRREGDVLAAVASSFLPTLLASDPAGRFLCRTFVPGTTVEAAVHSRPAREYRMKLTRGILKCAGDLFPRFHAREGGGYAIRDFKPRNLVVTEAGASVVLIDVGSVRSERSMLSKTRRPHRVGTGSWRFWAPEQLLERADVLDRRVDYFALASSVYYVLFGRAPYSNRSKVGDLAHAYSERHASLTRRLAHTTWVPRPLATWITQCLHPDPARRPSQGVPETLD